MKTKKRREDEEGEEDYYKKLKIKGINQPVFRSQSKQEGMIGIIKWIWKVVLFLTRCWHAYITKYGADYSKFPKKELKGQR